MARIKMENISAQMISAAAEQESSSGNSKVWDANFPLLSTPLNRKILVYIPKDVEERKVELLIHDTIKGKSFGQARCINGLTTGFEQFGYTGDCPYCHATEAAWELYNLKLDQKAAELGISRDNDPDNLLKGTKDNLLREMAVRNADKYVCFPIVLIPSDAMGNLDPNSQEGLKAVYVLWRKQRYDDKFSAEVLDDRESPAGTFERWSFTYDTKGQAPTPMLSAKALSIKIIEKADQLAALTPYVDGCEKVVAPFTQLQAIDNIKALNFYEFSEVEANAEACIKSTRAMLAAASTMTPVAGAALGQAQAAPALGTQSAADVIANFKGAGTAFGQAQVAPAGAAGVAPAQGIAPTGVAGVAPAPNMAGVAGVAPAPNMAGVAGVAPAPNMAGVAPAPAPEQGTVAGVAPVAPTFNTPAEGASDNYPF